MTTSEPLIDGELLAKLDRVALAVRKPTGGYSKGEKRSTRRGASVEFADYRDYTPGDDLRYVDWNTAARLDRLYVKLFVEEEDIAVTLLLDTSRSMEFGQPSKLRYAAQLAAAIGYVALSHNDRVTVQPYAASLGRSLPPQRGRAGVPLLFRLLERLQAQGATDVAQCARRYAATARRPGLTLLLSDMLDPTWKEGARALLAAGHELTVIQVLARDEAEPRLTGDVRVIDAETGDTREMSISPHLLARYRDAFDRFTAEIDRFCRESGTAYHRVLTDEPLDAAALAILRPLPA